MKGVARGVGIRPERFRRKVPHNALRLALETLRNAGSLPAYAANVPRGLVVRLGLPIGSGPTQARGRYVARRPTRVSRNSHEPGISDAKCCAQPTSSNARNSADVRYGFPSKAPQRSTYPWLESPWAADDPDNHPVSKAFRIPDPVNGSTKPSASPAG